MLFKLLAIGCSVIVGAQEPETVVVGKDDFPPIRQGESIYGFVVKRIDFFYDKAFSQIEGYQVTLGNETERKILNLVGENRFNATNTVETRLPCIFGIRFWKDALGRIGLVGVKRQAKKNLNKEIRDRFVEP